HRAPVGRERPEVVHAVGVETERVLNADLQGRRTGDVAVVVHRGCQGETIVEGREDLDRHRGHRAERAEAVGGVRIAPTAPPPLIPSPTVKLPSGTGSMNCGAPPEWR